MVQRGVTVLGCLACLVFTSVQAADDLPPILVPDGFTTTVFHPGLGPARHMAVRDNGDVYVSRSQRRSMPQFNIEASNGAIIALRDTNGDGTADVVEPFGPIDVSTGLRIRDNWLYYSSNVAVYRIPLDDQLVPTGPVQAIAGGFPMQRSHGTKTFAFDNAGNLYVNVGAPSNACEVKRMAKNGEGFDPCPQLERAAGVWKFKADGQVQDQVKDGERFVTGTRNLVAMAWHPTANKLYFVNHGRDSLGLLYPDLYSRQANAELPAEEFHAAEAGDNFGWPYTYFDPIRGRRMQGPEYGGDGQTEADGDYKDPLIGFPAHWAPNDLLFHSGKNLPAKYAEGAFIVFHGSWNRIGMEQGGFKVVFVPMKNGEVSGEWEVFADGFKGAPSVRNPGDAAYRPTGLAEGPDGELYISEDKRGRIWQVRWTGAAPSTRESLPAPAPAAAVEEPAPAPVAREAEPEAVEEAASAEQSEKAPRSYRRRRTP